MSASISLSDSSSTRPKPSAPSSSRARELLGAEGFGRVLELSLGEMLADIRNDLGEFGVLFDHWSSERALSDSGAIDHALAVLESRGRRSEKRRVGKECRA